MACSPLLPCLAAALGAAPETLSQAAAGPAWRPTTRKQRCSLSATLLARHHRRPTGARDARACTHCWLMHSVSASTLATSWMPGIWGDPSLWQRRHAWAHLELHAAACTGVCGRHLCCRQGQLLDQAAAPVVNDHLPRLFAHVAPWLGSSCQRCLNLARDSTARCGAQSLPLLRADQQAAEAACGTHLVAGSCQIAAAWAPCKHNAAVAQVPRRRCKQLPLQCGVRDMGRSACRQESLAAFWLGVWDACKRARCRGLRCPCRGGTDAADCAAPTRCAAYTARRAGLPLRRLVASLTMTTGAKQLFNPNSRSAS